jgi:hypothetical protein
VDLLAMASGVMKATCTSTESDMSTMCARALLVIPLPAGHSKFLVLFAEQEQHSQFHETEK